MSFLDKLFKLGGWLLLGGFWVLYGSLLFDKLAKPEYRNLDGTGYTLIGLLLAVITAAAISNAQSR